MTPGKHWRHFFSPIIIQILAKLISQRLSAQVKPKQTDSQFIPQIHDQCTVENWPFQKGLDNSECLNQTLGRKSVAINMTRKQLEEAELSQPFHHQDLISNFPYCLSCNSYNFTAENLLLDQLIIPFSIFFFLCLPCQEKLFLGYSWELKGLFP